MTVAKDVSLESTEPNRSSSARWLSNWNPEDPDTWDHQLAWRTLSITTFTLTLSFATWFLVSAIAPKLQGLGYNITNDQLYWLAAMPGLAGGLLRLVWTFLPPMVGTRRLVTFSTLLLALPLIGWFFALQNPETSYGVLLALAFLAGIGGGNFSGFMPSTSYFFPRAKQGTALAVQAGIGNLGVSIVQLLTPWFIGFALVGGSLSYAATGKPTTELWMQNAALIYLPLVLAGAALAWIMLRSVPIVSSFKQQRDIFRNPHTWIMTAMYMMTFGTFSGFAAQLGLLIKNQFGAFSGAPDPLRYLFLGALVGSLTRIAFGPLTDRFGGAVWTTVSGLGIATSLIFTSFFVAPTSVDQFTPFLWGMLAIFFFSGIGNASTFKQMPMIFKPRQAGGVIGWTAAIAAFGPFLFGVLIATFAPRPFYLGLAVFSLICVALNIWFYQRKGAQIPC